MHIKCISMLYLKGVCRMSCRWSKVPACMSYLYVAIRSRIPHHPAVVGRSWHANPQTFEPPDPSNSRHFFCLPTSPNLAMADIATAAGPSELQAKQVVYCGGKYYSSAIQIYAKFISIPVCSLPPEVGGNLGRLSFPIHPSNLPAA
jgi:hypothetical protein